MKTTTPIISYRCYFKLMEITITNAENEIHARQIANREFFNRNLTLINMGFFADPECLGDGVFKFTFFDFYFLEKLSFVQYLHHLYRKLITTAKIYIGINPCVVIIETNAGQ